MSEKNEGGEKKVESPITRADLDEMLKGGKEVDVRSVPKGQRAAFVGFGVLDDGDISVQMEKDGDGSPLVFGLLPGFALVRTAAEVVRRSPGVVADNTSENSCELLAKRFEELSFVMEARYLHSKGDQLGAMRALVAAKMVDQDIGDADLNVMAEHAKKTGNGELGSIIDGLRAAKRTKEATAKGEPVVVVTDKSGRSH
jgi:hypothetical protein